MTELEINSRDWWEDYFLHHWEAFDGSAQTWYFMERLVANLPQPELDWTRAEPRTILDWGCAMGQGVAVLTREFPQCAVTGLDWSSTAIEEARRRHPQCRFEC